MSPNRQTRQKHQNLLICEIFCNFIYDVEIGSLQIGGNYISWCTQMKYSSVNSDIAIQWEWSNFDPLQNSNPLTNYDKLSTIDYIHETNT